MPNTYLSHEELQHIEHCNKVLENHLEVVNVITSLSEEKISTMLANLRQYLTALKEVQQVFGETVSNIYRSAGELKKATGSSQEVMVFIDTVVKLEKALNDETILKLRRILVDKE